MLTLSISQMAAEETGHPLNHTSQTSHTWKNLRGPISSPGFDTAKILLLAKSAECSDTYSVHTSVFDPSRANSAKRIGPGSCLF